MFSDGLQETTDLPWTIEARKVVTENLIMDIDTVIKGNRHRNIRDFAIELNFSIGTVHNIVYVLPGRNS